MSTLVNRLLCPNYEDYDLYGCNGNAYVGFPELWPAEAAANAAVCEEQNRQRALMRLMGYTRTRKLLEHFRAKRYDKKYMADIVRAALEYMADEMLPRHQEHSKGQVTTPSEPVKPQRFIQQDDNIVAYALATLADDNGWERIPIEHYNGKSIYKIV